jgi:tetratricopeptide (TPR) repeat protein
MHKLVSLTAIASLLWIPLLVHAESFAVDKQGPMTETPTNPDTLAAADALFSYGEDLERDRQALAMLERAVAMDATNYQVLWRVARAYYQVGDKASAREKRRYFEHGIEMGQRAVVQQPTGVEGHFWLGANYGGLSEIQGVWQAFQMVKKVRAEMEMALRLQADYEHGNAYRALGEIARQLPGILGGNLKRAIGYLEQGVRVAPQNMAMKFALAEAYRDAGQQAASQRQLQEILKMPVQSTRPQADRHTQDKARQLLRK